MKIQVFKEKTLTGLIVLSILVVGFLFLEGMSVRPHFELEQCHIIDIQSDASPMGFIGQTQKTLVEWDRDGLRGYVGGALGVKGEVIRAFRQRGTESVFGVFGGRQ